MEGPTARLTAMAEVLQIISRTSFDVHAVLEAVVERATSLCRAQAGFIYRLEGDVYRLDVALNITPEFRAFTERSPIRLYAALADQVIRFRDGLERIARPRILATTTGLTAALVLLEGLALYMVARSLRIDGLSVTGALAAYYFSIGVALMIPIFTNLGTLEAGGVAALITLGVNREGAVAVMVLDRALIIAVAFVLAVIFGLAFRDLVRRAVRAA